MNALAPLQRLVVNATARHSATVIIVHGLGDSGEGWEPVARTLARDPDLAHIKWVLPHAPMMKVTVNSGMEMPAWFDITSFDLEGGDEDEEGMQRTVNALNKLIETELDAAPSLSADRVVLGGFSQGAGMSLLTGLTTERKLGGIACLSGRLLLRSKIKARLTKHSSKLPIFWGHGKDDPLVTLRLAEMSKECLMSAGFKSVSEDSPAGIEYHAYAGVPHSVSPEEIADLGKWLKKVVPKTE